MKTNFYFRENSGIIVFVVTFSLVLHSCQKLNTDNQVPQVSEIRSALVEAGQKYNYFGPETFTLTSKAAIDTTFELVSSDFEYLENFALKVQNGNGGNTRVTKLEIIIDGTVVVTRKDFYGKNLYVSKQLTGLKSQSKLQVKMAGSKGRFVSIAIEGDLRNGMIADIDGNFYRTVQICGRWWMAENLRTTRFNDGTPILNVTGDQWSRISSQHIPAYCWYNNDSTYKKIYGGLYNEGAVTRTSGKNVCPVGWRVADAEWLWMIHCLDPDANDWGIISMIAGNLVNETGNSHWNCPDNTSTNQTGLTIVPGGDRINSNPPFSGIGNIGVYWLGANGKLRFYCGGAVGFSEGWDDFGLSIRCVKD